MVIHTAMVSSAVETCQRKRKRTSWWNQVVKKAIQTLKDAFTALLQTGRHLIYNPNYETPKTGRQVQSFLYIRR